ncbi:C-Jun-amino-terminal kinase-interacting protein 3 [Eumeta japonica]|uniref:C-Jun-amino-terminal kinase-interacting protein 3 n=1 Tax=Eumeta variegata TaxID=151549 RepID=A0A4C2A4L5_EUMVA|nr:C-Jun-amino-terminal kinase-interacting protein 3 [Eumeta japonica]
MGVLRGVPRRRAGLRALSLHFVWYKLSWWRRGIVFNLKSTSKHRESSQHFGVQQSIRAEIIESFSMSDKHILCIASIPGAVAEDYKEYEERMAQAQEEEKLLQSTPKKEASESHSINGSNSGNTSINDNSESKEIDIGSSKLVKATLLTPATTPVQETESTLPQAPKVSSVKTVEEPNYSSQDSPPLESTPKKASRSSPEPGIDAFAQEQSNAESRQDLPEDRQFPTIMPTMWLGTKNGNLYVHSAVGNYSKCLVIVKLSDAVLSIVPCASRCIVALADGTVTIFARSADGQWDFTNYWSVVLGDPKCSVRCLSAVGCTVWCGYRNRVHVLEPRSRKLWHSLEAHPRHESQVRQMAWLGDGVWISIKMDSTLRLYHAHTYQHLKDVDIEPYVSKMLGTGKLGFSLVRITALLISSGRLWIGTSNGVVISVPFTETTGRELGPVPLLPRRIDLPESPEFIAVTSSLVGRRQGCAQRFRQGPLTVLRERPVSPSGTLPLCSMAHAQLSFHGHRDAVTFFVAVPGANTSNASEAYDSSPPMLVISGGEGYIDFRIEEHVDDVRDTASHLIVWQTQDS